MNPLILIPARMGSTRLPGKPLALIEGKPMILHVYERALAANLGPVWVACGEQEIADAITSVGGNAVLTDPALPSGTDRVYAALEAIDPHGAFTHIINIQGDLPLLDIHYLSALCAILSQPATQMATLVSPFATREEAEPPSVVKAILSQAGSPPFPRALYFTRTLAPYGEGPYYYHIGLYGYTRQTLQTLVNLPVSPLEKRESLEQLRALEHGITIHTAIVEGQPLSVDTPEDLTRVQNVIRRR